MYTKIVDSSIEIYVTEMWFYATPTGLWIKHMRAQGKGNTCALPVDSLSSIVYQL